MFVFLVSFSSETGATNSKAKTSERLFEVKFTGATTDKVALQTARQLVKAHWSQFMQVEDYDYSKFEDFAQYVPLHSASGSKSAIIYQLRSTTGEQCGRLGCNIYVFEKRKAGEWRLALYALSHGVWISNRKTQGYNDILLQSYYEQPGNPGSGERKGRFVWNGSKYVFKNP